MSDDGDGTAYTRGPATYRKVPRLRTKPSSINHRGKRDSGGGYERFRSYEHDPTAPGDGKTDVYVSHHRLLAVVTCYPEDMPVSEILAHLDGKDVHHTTEVEWCNFGESPNFDQSGIVVREHSSHSAITQAEMRAFAADSKPERREARRRAAEINRCEKCDEEADVLASVPGYDGDLCLECSQAVADVLNEPIKL